MEIQFYFGARKTIDGVDRSKQGGAAASHSITLIKITGLKATVAMEVASTLGPCVDTTCEFNKWAQPYTTVFSLKKIYVYVCVFFSIVSEKKYHSRTGHRAAVQPGADTFFLVLKESLT